MAKNVIAALILAAGTLGVASPRADVLLVDGLDVDRQSAGQRPKAGTRMDRVAETYGEPSSRGSAVGDPPITRWDYPGFSVYFEHDRVIHAVVRR